ncbi:MAG TPA: molybdopterin cofactor-binding domain-containing protein, partial [Novosphingobium sp.]|nr:molybdopterin cofactor-binding domain-containing protein [Novosphingobium sp.]
AQTDPAGAITAWRLRAALPATTSECAARLLGGATRAQALARQADGPDALALEGAVPPYAIAHLAVEHVPVAVGLPTGRLRGNAHGYTAFFTECFLDELAASLAREPLSYRMAMLDGDARLAQCLQRVSALAGWNGGHDGSGQGLACHRIGEGCIAAIATVRRSDAGVEVNRIVAVADIGRIVHADIARQQIEGGLIYGIGLALGSAGGWAQGLPQARRLADMALPVLANCPEVSVELVAASGDPADPGELGVAVAAPAIANALFSATGLRYRRLPLGSEE